MKDKLSKLFKPKPIFDYAIYILIVLGVVALDQLTKALAVRFLMPVDTVPIIEGVIHLTYLENRGAAFGMLADAPWVFNTFSVIAIVAILLYLFLGHADTRLYSIPLAMIAGGGIGNMIDRTALGYVVDFIDFRLINFAVFNGADSFVCVGAGLLILALVLDIIKEAKATAGAGAKPDTESDTHTEGANSTDIDSTHSDTGTDTEVTNGTDTDADNTHGDTDTDTEVTNGTDTDTESIDSTDERGGSER